MVPHPHLIDMALSGSHKMVLVMVYILYGKMLLSTSKKASGACLEPHLINTSPLSDGSLVFLHWFKWSGPFIWNFKFKNCGAANKRVRAMDQLDISYMGQPIWIFPSSNSSLGSGAHLGPCGSWGGGGGKISMRSSALENTWTPIDQPNTLIHSPRF